MERAGAGASLCSGCRARFEQAPKTSVLIAHGLRCGRLVPFQPIAPNGESVTPLDTPKCDNLSERLNNLHRFRALRYDRWLDMRSV